MVAQEKYVNQQFKSYHSEGLTTCPDNKWPLALIKETEQNMDNDEQAYYNYPLVRYPQSGGLNTATEMNTYYFRFNETQRIYFEIGSNFITNHAVLKLRTSYTPGEGTTYIGKQMGNLNVIDMDVPPGDYALILTQYSSAETKCGMFSLKGLLSMASAESI